jgi:hypothetical protein
VDLGNAFHADQRVAGGTGCAAAVGVADDVVGEQALECLQVTGAGCGDEGAEEVPLRGARSAWMRLRARLTSWREAVSVDPMISAIWLYG